VGKCVADKTVDAEDKNFHGFSWNDVIGIA